MRRGGQTGSKRWLLITLLMLGVFWAGDNALAVQAQIKVESKYTTLLFNSADDMVAFHGAIKYPSGNSLANLFSNPDARDVERDLIRKVDLLFEKVQAILDMRKAMRKVRVRVVSGESELQEAYYKIYRRKDNVRGWYVFDFNTVYLNARDVHEGMLAHELGHAIIDHFLTVRPPRATAEILARYVDKNLFEEVRQY